MESPKGRVGKAVHCYYTCAFTGMTGDRRTRLFFLDTSRDSALIERTSSGIYRVQSTCVTHVVAIYRNVFPFPFFYVRRAY
jgi:hypothetical protein